MIFTFTSAHAVEDWGGGDPKILYQNTHTHTHPHPHPPEKIINKYNSFFCFLLKNNFITTI